MRGTGNNVRPRVSRRCDVPVALASRPLQPDSFAAFSQLSHVWPPEYFRSPPPLTAMTPIGIGRSPRGLRWKPWLACLRATAAPVGTIRQGGAPSWRNCAWPCNPSSPSRRGLSQGWCRPHADKCILPPCRPARLAGNRGAQALQSPSTKPCPAPCASPERDAAFPWDRRPKLRQEHVPRSTSWKPTSPPRDRWHSASRGPYSCGRFTATFTLARRSTFPRSV